MYKITLKKKAQKSLDKLDKRTFVRISEAILGLKYSPQFGNLKKLSGKYKNMFRLRVGDYRVLFTRDDEEKEIIVYIVDQRGSVY